MTAGWGVRDPRWAGIRTVPVSVAGRRVRTLRTPGDDTDGGPAHLLVHGLGGSATNWLDVLAGLADRPAVATDLPGFGRTAPPPGGTRLRTQARFLAALVDELGLGPVVLHGSSMGGLIALLAAADRPGLVHGLVLVSPAVPIPVHRLGTVGPRALLRFAPFLVPGVGGAVTTLAWRALSPEQLYAQARDFVYAHPERLRPAVRDVALEDYRAGQRLPWRPRAFAAAAHSLVWHLLGGRAARTALRTTTAPTLLLRGTEDPLVPAVAVETAARRRPDWTLRRLPSTGHVAALESPDRYLAAVDAWLAPRR